MVAIRQVHYVNDGRGYRLQTDDKLTDAEKLALKKMAFPKGQHWQPYNGANSIKAFTLPSGIMAVSNTLVTDKTDFGRPGVLQATIDLVLDDQYESYLLDLYNNILKENDLSDKDIPVNSRRIMLDNLLRRQTIFNAPYQSPAQWQQINASILKSILELPRSVRLQVPFTTFALDIGQDEQVVGAPTSMTVTQRRRGKTFIDLPVADRVKE